MSSGKNELQKAGITAQALAKYKPENYHLLLPSQTFLDNLGPMVKPSIEEIRVNGDPDAGEVYLLQGEDKKAPQDQKVAMRPPAYERIGMAAGVSFHPDSGLVVDEPSRKIYKAIAMMKKPDGSWMVKSFEKQINLTTLEKQFKAQYEKKMPYAKKKAQQNNWNWPGDQQWIDQMVARDLLQKETFMVELAQTGAQKRAYQHFLGLKGSYTRAELQKPFVSIRMDFAPDMKDPQQKQFLLEQSMGAVPNLYPGQSSPASRAVPAEAEVISSDPAEMDTTKLAPDYEGILSNPDLDEEKQKEVDEDQERLLELQGMDEKERRQLLAAILKKAKYDHESDPAGIVKLWHEGHQAMAILKMEQNGW